MMMALLIAGIGFVLAGLLGILFGIPVKEFSFGNTLILAGVVAGCTGALMLGLWTVVRQLKDIAQRLDSTGLGSAPGSAAGPGHTDTATPRPAFPASLPGASDAPRDRAAENDGPSLNRVQAGIASAESSATSLPPWHDETATRDRPRNEAAPVPPAEAAPAPKQRRNLLFSSTSRKERDRAGTRMTDPAVDPRPASPAAVPPQAKPGEAPAATFDDAWPQSERARTADGAARRSGRTPSTFAEDAAASQPPVAPPTEDQPAVTVLKSGVVDGMAYSLYSDGSIEAQMPEGMMRFASIDELRAHLDHRA